MYQTTIGKDRNGITRALTSIPLGFENRELRIETRKHSIYGGVYCSATVVTITPYGFSHAIGLGRGGDYSKTIEHSRDQRATERAIAGMHAKCMAGADQILAAAVAHYKPATVEA